MLYSTVLHVSCPPALWELMEQPTIQHVSDKHLTPFTTVPDTCCWNIAKICRTMAAPLRFGM